MYRVIDQRSNTAFALKVLDPHPANTSAAEARARFLREAKLLFSLQHENIVRIYEAGELPDGKLYLKLEYFPGSNLQMLRSERSFSTEDCIWIVAQLAAAVEYSHRQGIVHRDIKPSNILVSDQVNDFRLIDFGLGILVEEAIARARLATSAQKFGNAFAPSELLENPKAMDPAIDVYSIGAVWFWLHAGRSPQGTGLEETIAEFDIGDDLKRLLIQSLMSEKKGPSSAIISKQLQGLVQRQP